MPRLLPKTIHGRLSTARVIVEKWAADPGAVGLSEAEIEALRQVLAEAEAARDAARAARLAAESATAVQTIAVDALVRRLGATSMKVKALGQLDPAVAAASGLPDSNTPTYTEVPPPKPDSVRCVPQPDGAVAVEWRSDLSRRGATFYSVRRELWTSPDTNSPPKRELLEPVRGHGFVDRTLPTGFTRVDYFITPVRQRGGGRSRGSVAGPAVQCTYHTGTSWFTGAAATTPSAKAAA